MEPVSTRIESWLRRAIVEFGESNQEGPSEALRRIAEEWWALNRFPHIEFRDGVMGRRAGLRGGPDVWEIVMVWKDYEPDREAFYGHFAGRIDGDALDQALSYFKRFPDQIERHLQQNARMEARLHPGGVRP